MFPCLWSNVAPETLPADGNRLVAGVCDPRPRLTYGELAAEADENPKRTGKEKESERK